MKYPHLWMRLYNTPLMIQPEKAVIIESVLRSRFIDGHTDAAPRAMDDGYAPAPRPAAFAYRGSDKPYKLTEGRVAVIPIVGALVQRGDSIDAMSGLISYNRIGGLMSAASADDDVGAILLEVDSPGGEVHGVFDLAKKIYAAREAKPVWAAINEESYSAGYALTSAAERILAPRSACLGSIGVIALHVDQSQRDSKSGCVYTAIYAGAYKNDWTEHAPLSDHARKTGQAEVDRYYELFCGGVSLMRGIPQKVVRGTEAGIMSPEQAIELGLADEVATFSDTLAALEAHVDARSRTLFYTGTRTAASQLTSTQKETTMAPVTPSAAATLTAEQQQQAIEAARTEGHATGVAAGRSEGATEERARIAAIMGSDEAKGRTKHAQHLAHETDTSVDQAKKMLAASAVEALAPANPLAAAMAALKNPQVGADTPEDETRGQPLIDTAAIYAARRQGTQN